MKSYWIITLVLLFGLGSCVQKQSSGSGTVEKVEEKAEVAAENGGIPLDENLPGAAISLQKNFYVILDCSGSMAEDVCGGGDKSFYDKMRAAQWATTEFVAKVPKDVNLGLCLLTDGDVVEVVPLSTDRAAFLAAVQATGSGGGTPLGEAIVVATNKLAERYKLQLGYGEYRIIAITDGEATGMSIDRAGEYARKSGFPIYTIGFCMDADHSLRKYSTSYRTANSSIDLAKGLEETLGEADSFDPTTFGGK
ncbi:MAG: VWA domain-containing protein [bacterium]|nr:VWA domain-containing protein [bacterium]